MHIRHFESFDSILKTFAGNKTVRERDKTLRVMPVFKKRCTTQNEKIKGQLFVVVVFFVCFLLRVAGVSTRVLSPYKIKHLFNLRWIFFFAQNPLA